MSPLEAIQSVLRNAFRFDGRASRSEYWWWVLAWIVGWFLALVVIGTLVAGSVRGADSGSRGASVAAGIIALAGLILIIPSLAVFVRRLHDTGRSGWWWLIGLIPYIGGFVLLVFTALDSQPGPNRWGPPPVGSSYFDPRTWRMYANGQGWAAGPPPGWGQPGWQPAPGWTYTGQPPGPILSQPTQPPTGWAYSGQLGPVPPQPSGPPPGWGQPPAPTAWGAPTAPQAGWTQPSSTPSWGPQSTYPGQAAAPPPPAQPSAPPQQSAGWPDDTRR